MLLALYKNVMQVSTPFLEAYLKKRMKKGKEDAMRFPERRGIAGRPRSDKKLVWFHGASVGESLSLLAVIHRFLEDYPAAEVMVTTGTVTSAKLMAERLPAHAFHQYMPVDHPAWVKRFLDHWKPDAVVWSESEFWPNMLAEIRRRHITSILLNARMSEKSFAKWQWVKGSVKDILNTFSLCLAQNDDEAARLLALGAAVVKTSGNLKYAANPLPYDAEKLKILKEAVGERPLLLWASTHPGEEEIASRLHVALKQSLPDILTIIVPRHPGRGQEVADICGRQGLKNSLRSEEKTPAVKDDVYIADTLGELGIFYRFSPVSVIGGSFVPHGGHNPIEPAQLGSLCFYGPHMFNFTMICRDFETAHAVFPVENENELKEKILPVLQNPAAYVTMIHAAKMLTEEKAHVVDTVMKEIEPLFSPLLRKRVS